MHPLIYPPYHTLTYLPRGVKRAPEGRPAPRGRAAHCLLSAGPKTGPASPPPCSCGVGCMSRGGGVSGGAVLRLSTHPATPHHPPPPHHPYVHVHREGRGRQPLAEAAEQALQLLVVLALAGIEHYALWRGGGRLVLLLVVWGGEGEDGVSETCTPLGKAAWGQTCWVDAATSAAVLSPRLFLLSLLVVAWSLPVPLWLPSPPFPRGRRTFGCCSSLILGDGGMLAVACGGRAAGVTARPACGGM